MFVDMKQANTWKPLGSVTKQIAAKLIALREGEIKGGPAPAVGVESRHRAVAATRGNDGKERRGTGQSDEPRVKFSAASPLREEVGPLPRAHGRPPFFSKSSTIR